MTAASASLFTYGDSRSDRMGDGLRRWLNKVLFLHLDTWPWAAAGTPMQTLASRTMHNRPPQLPPDREHDDGEKNSPFNRFEHEPVLLHEALSFLQPAPGKLFMDATLGGGGHSAGLLRAGAQVLGFDQDEMAIASATGRLHAHEDCFVALPMNFRRFAEVLDETGVGAVDGILADLGVSSHQIDTAERGFSFQQDGPLDMRMNPHAECTAASIVNEWSAEDMRRIFQECGEEPLARRAATAIVRRRAQRPFLRTLDLADTLATVMPRHGKTHPATKVFQSLRIEVNDELGALRDLLEHAPRLLKPGGRIVIVSFHSLEDRMVKQAFQKRAAEWIDRPEWPEARPNPDLSLRILTKKPISAAPEETSRNPRSRSARLRAAERLSP